MASMKQENEITAHNIKALREASRLTQAEFGEQFGTSQKSIWAYEAGNNKPKGEFTFALCSHFGISPEFFGSTKIKINKAGEISNLPKEDIQIQKCRKEIQELKKDFDEAVNIFYTGIERVLERLDTLERNSKRR